LEGFTQDLFDDLAASAELDEKHGDQLGGRHPQPSSLVGFSPTGLVQVSHRLLLHVLASLFHRRTDGLAGALLQGGDGSQAHIGLEEIGHNLGDVPLAQVIATA
jgi:hypothetical protein